MSDPDFNQLLGPFLLRFEPAGQPAFLAALERSAAGRYREWADRAPEHAEGLRACAAREEEIAGIAEGLFPPDAGTRSLIQELLPEAQRIYDGLFVDLSLAEQWRTQAIAERTGAAAWRALSAVPKDASIRDDLLRCADLEEESARYLDKLAA
jgi:hypothetical protein